MKRLSILACAAFAAALIAPLGSLAAPSGAAFDPANNALFKRMLALNAALQSYKASVHLDVALKTFPYLSPSFDGSVYFEKPNRQAVVFDTVPALASQFKKVYPNLDPPSSWPALYDVSVLGDSDGQTQFRLVPKKAGRVQHLDVTVDDANATVKSYTWTYSDGGYVTFNQQFTSIDGNYLVDKQSGHVELPSTKADVQSNFSNYRLNVAIEDSVFDGK
jgi:outer membrane lipoprotein-sorting protein